MAETYSSNLQLTLIGTGDLAGSWGGVVNNNIGSGLETAITGYYNVVYASADQQVYINNNQFSNTGGSSSSNGRNIYFYCSGTNFSSQYLYVPANQKLYVVNNATSAGVIKVSNGSIGSPSGAAVTVPNGSTSFVYNDGTNINLIAYSPLAISTPYTFAMPVSGTAVTINGAINYYATKINGVSTSGQSLGLFVAAGTTTADTALYLSNYNSSVSLMRVAGDGSVTIGTGIANEGAGTLNVQSGYYINGVNQFQSGSFTGTYTGFSSASTATIYYSIAGNSCTLAITAPSVVNSNSSSLTLTNIPSNCQPTRQQYLAIPDGSMQNNGGPVYALASAGASAFISTSTISFLLNNSLSGWASSNNKGPTVTISVTYLLN